jgi:VWFA-related protein
MDALIEFVRTRLLPQDQVAVVAYDRTALFTTEHAKVVRLLERYRDQHEAIEAALDHWFSGLTFLFGRRTPPPGIQRDIDKLFDPPGLPEIRQRLYGGEVDFEEDRRRYLTSDARLIGDAIEPEAVLRPEAPDDFEKLYSAIEELRHVQGEKHLIVLTDWGIGGTRAVHTDGLAAAAADARVAVWTVQTGGLAASWDPDGRFMSRGWLQHFNMGDSRAASEHTGGGAWFHQFSDGPLDRIDRATRFHYLLGYYPSNARWDGANRTIEVTVTRPDVRVLNRRSYFANQTLVPYDRRRFIAYSRVLSAAAGPVARDVQVKLAASVTRRDAGNAAVAVEVAITPSTIRFIDRNGRHEAALNVAIFAASASGTLLGEKWDRVDLELPPATFARLARESVVYTATLDLPGVPRHLKAVVYDAFADRLGSATQEVR